MRGRPHKVSPDPKFTEHSAAVAHLLQEKEVVKAVAPLDCPDHRLAVDDDPQLVAFDVLSGPIDVPRRTWPSATGALL